ncbi:MAG: nucleotide disphospho-sugar-binding domain-containing protein [Candidatus Limnocylindrales bacterium]
MTDARTIVFFPEGAYGPTNNCVGIGRVLRERGHRIVFVVEESFAGTLEALGFEERLMRLGPAPDVPEVPGQFWIDFIRDTAPVFRKSTLEQLGQFIAPTWQALIDGAKYVDPRLAEIFDELAPDAIVQDNVIGFPAIAASGRPWVRIVSCNPAELKDPAIPPFSSGYPAGDRSGWAAFLEEVRRTHADMYFDFEAFCREHGDAGLSYGPLGPDFIAESPYLNLYAYPAEVDYPRERPLGPTWHRLDSTVRAPDVPLGAAGPPARAGWSVDLPLAGVARVGGREPHAASGGPAGDDGAPGHRVQGSARRRDRAPRQSDGEGFLPQPAILPQVDLVITHGGNNTVTEALHHGKPMIVLPLFWDQVDNAQRVDETGLGRRLSTYGFRDEELTDAIDELLADEPLAARLAAMSARIKASNGHRPGRRT